MDVAEVEGGWDGVGEGFEDGIDDDDDDDEEEEEGKINCDESSTCALRSVLRNEYWPGGSGTELLKWMSVSTYIPCFQSVFASSCSRI